MLRGVFEGYQQGVSEGFNNNRHITTWQYHTWDAIALAPCANTIDRSGPAGRDPLDKPRLGGQWVSSDKIGVDK